MSQIFSKQPDSTPNLQTIYNSNTNIHLSTNVSVKAYIISNGNMDIRTILTNMLSCTNQCYTFHLSFAVRYRPTEGLQLILPLHIISQRCTCFHSRESLACCAPTHTASKTAQQSMQIKDDILYCRFHG